MKSSIKKIAVTVYSFFEHIGRARAAGVFARAGNFGVSNDIINSCVCMSDIAFTMCTKYTWLLVDNQVIWSNWFLI